MNSLWQIERSISNAFQVISIVSNKRIVTIIWLQYPWTLMSSYLWRRLIGETCPETITLTLRKMDVVPKEDFSSVMSPVSQLSVFSSLSSIWNKTTRGSFHDKRAFISEKLSVCKSVFQLYKIFTNSKKSCIKDILKNIPCWKFCSR